MKELEKDPFPMYGTMHTYIFEHAEIKYDIMIVLSSYAMCLTYNHGLGDKIHKIREIHKSFGKIGRRHSCDILVISVQDDTVKPLELIPLKCFTCFQLYSFFHDYKKTVIFTVSR